MNDRRKLIVALGASVLGIIVLLAYLIWSGYQEAIHTGETTTRNYSAIINTRLDATLRRTEADLLDLAGRVPVAALDKKAVPRHAAEIDASLDTRLLNFPELAGIRVFDADGDLIYTSNSKTTLRSNIADREYFMAARDGASGKPIFSEALTSRVTGRRSLFYLRALRDGQGSFRGIVIAVIELDYFLKLFQALDLGPRGVVSVYRSDNFNPVMRWPVIEGRTDRALPPENPTRKAVAAGMQSSTLAFTAFTDGIERIYSHETLERYPFFVTTGLAQADVLAGWKKRSLAVGATSLLLLGVLAALLLRLARADAAQTRAMAELTQSEQRFRSLLDMSSDFYWESDAEHRLLPAGMPPTDASKSTRFQRGVRVGERRWDVPSVAPDEAGWQEHIRTLEAHLPFRHFRISRHGADGEVRHISISGDPLFDPGGRFRGYRGVGTDVTDRARAEESLRALSQRLRLGQSAARLIVFEWDAARDHIDWSDSPEWMRGPLPESGKYPVLREQIHPEDRELLLTRRARTLETGEAQTFEFRFVRTDGQMLWLRSQHVVSAYADGKVARLLVALLDITEYKRAQSEIRYLAYQDHLTGLPNRVLLKDRMDQAIAHADRSRTQVALLFIDVDNFKTINDSLGHTVGDALLKMVAATLKDSVRPTDTVSRQGGDEFIVLLTDLPEPRAVTPVLEKMFKRFNSPFNLEGEHLFVSISVGVAHYPDDGKDFEALSKKADMAMYRAKESGKNAYRFFDQQLNTDAIGRMRLRTGLRTALDRGEFVLHYQPQIDLESGAVVGAEALIRWNGAQLGMVSPAEFIPVAEESGLIVPIGDWVLREACRQAAAWRDAGLPGLVIAVNMSAVQFRRGGLEKAVVAALEASGLHPSMLELELTESILIKDTDTTLATVRRLKALGLKLSIDDFGTGYSSLSYLKQFSVDKLKIDQSFIRDLASNPEDAAIVRAIIQMAQSLDLRTIAEGVENESKLHYLRLYGCNEAQGYYFARPMPAGDFAEYLSRSAIAPRSVA